MLPWIGMVHWRFLIKLSLGNPHPQEREIALDNVPGDRNWNEIYKRMNTYSRGNLEKIAYLNGKTINEIIKRRVYRDPESIWAVFRRSEYGPVIQRILLENITKTSKKHIYGTITLYGSKIPNRIRFI